MAEGEPDLELEALRTVLGALAPLSGDARARVLEYVVKKLGIKQVDPQSAYGQPSTAREHTPTGSAQGSTTRRIVDIRSFKEEKRPRSDNEMAAVVAYYLQELAPTSEHKDSIDVEDVKKYFKQAGFPLPNRPEMTLVNAKSAGYFDSAGTRGAYRLNPVGHNLVAHTLPSGTAEIGSRRISRKPSSNGYPKKPRKR